MNSVLLHSEPRFFSIWKKVLFLAALLLGIFHMLLALSRYYIDFWVFVPYERWFALGVLLVFLVSIIIFSEYRRQTLTMLEQLCSYEQIFVVSLFIWYAVVCAVLQLTEGIPYFKMEDWWILDAGISALILFPLSYYAGKEKAVPLIELLLHMILISYSIFTAWALWHVFHLDFPVFPSGEKIELSEGIKLCFCTHYNTTGAIACIMFALSLHMVCTQKTIGKIFYGIASLLHLIVLMLSNSRTAFLAGLFFIFAAGFFCSWNYWAKKAHFSKIFCIIICTLAGAVCGFIFWQIRSAITNSFDSLTGLTEASKLSYRIRKSIYPETLTAKNRSVNAALLAAREITPDLNGRTDIWRAALKVIFSSPKTFFFGVSPVGITHALVTIGGLTEEFYGTHNAFLDVAAEFGVPAMIAFLVFSIKITIRCLRLLFQLNGKAFKSTFIILLTVLTIFVLNLTEGYLIASFCIQSSLFFLLTGWIVALENTDSL